MVDDTTCTVFYIARGADENVEQKIQRFIETYKKFDAGLKHDFCVIVKGFADEDSEKQCLDLFSGLHACFLQAPDENFDVGAYAFAARNVSSDTVCLLNTNSEIMSNNWLAKLAVNLTQEVGIAGATGSYETLRSRHPDFPDFPNIHIRSNGLLIRRQHAIRFLPEFVPDKMAAWQAESGLRSLTRGILGLGLAIAVVGRNGRAYAPSEWPVSGTFRQDQQENLLIHDNQTRAYEFAHCEDKVKMARGTWMNFARTILNES